ncbi:MAG TPA: polyphosphate kinase [Saprospiraceae bacterium]|nr:MAG: polyphosphate:nucleotide phosphotransferase [Candidatus Parvibacillus calidus]MBX2937281.1 polyphosphate kinase [Saprospiraceae bacterium]MBK7740866.1 polyphosphate kinase [Candidatus Parvibacillus calidus]MBX7179089.1 polyphosphate kinase [Saprospiraceae bacterium]MCB0591165.1 polyphosphate kinase [Saprospiraceae bacterium]
MQKEIKLSKISTKAPKSMKKEDLITPTMELYERIGHLQHILYAEKKHSVLIVFQGPDASGKDGATKNVFSRCSPQGVRVEAFKKPSEEEMNHDFLWRIHANTPEKGFIQVFNRSHYEDILIQRVHKWIDEDRVHKRMAAINAFEELLQFDNNTLVLKFFMHISKDNQLKQLKERLEEPEKNWKHNPNDWEERKLWNEYTKAYEYALNHSSIPWHIVPVDNRWYRNYFIASVIVRELEALNMKLPVLDKNTLLADNSDD